MALATGLVTVTLDDGTSYVGHFVAANSFQPCASASTYPFTAQDTWHDGGQCDISYDVKIAVLKGLPAAGGPAPVVNGFVVSADGQTGLATFVKGKTTGEVLLTLKAGKWSVAQNTTGAATTGENAVSSGVSVSTLHALRARLPFQATSPAHVISH